MDILEKIYGTLFTPAPTFEYLRTHMPLGEAALVVLTINLFEGWRQAGELSISTIAVQVSVGTVGWLVLAGIVKLMAVALDRPVPYQAILTLSAFGGLPWLLTGPAQAVGGVAGSVLTVIAVLWFVSLEVWAVAVALGIDWWRSLLFVPLAFVGSLVAGIWVGNGLLTFLSLG